MEYESEFERLSKDLDDSERRELLSKIKKEDKYVLEVESNKKKENDNIRQLKIAGNTYLNYNFFSKIIVWIISFFTGRKKEEVVLDRMFSDIKKEIIRINPHIVNFKNSVLTNDFTRLILNLAEFCNSALHIVDEYFGDTVFYNSFMCWILEKEFNEELMTLLNKVDPENIEINYDIFKKEDEYFEEKNRRINKFFEKLTLTSFSDINLMFANFELILKIITFDFKALLLGISEHKTSLPLSSNTGVKFSSVSELLEKLFVILNAINFEYSDISFIENVNNYTESEEDGVITNKSLKEKDIDLIKKIFNIVDDLKSRIPFKLIFQYFKRDILYKTPVITKSFDIIKIYKEYKRNVINTLWESQLHKLKNKNQKRLIHDLFGEYKFDTLTNFNMSLKKDIDKNSHIKLSSVKKMNILAKFLNSIYKLNIEKIINRILIEGNFAKESKRNTLSSAYYLLYNAYELIKEFDTGLDKEKDMGRKIETFLKVISGDVDYTQTLQNTINDLNEMARQVLEEIYDGLWNMYNLISDMAKYGEAKNIQITNIDEIKIPGEVSVIYALKKAKKHFDSFFEIYELLEEF